VALGKKYGRKDREMKNKEENKITLSKKAALA
jgi:hypothetical protein